MKNLSKRIRFEVFKRDGFICQYCGQHPPKVLLEIDHINPKSKGGLDDINNLITACGDCNRGKSNISLKKIPHKLQQQIKVIKEKEEQLQEYNELMDEVRDRENADIYEVSKAFSEFFFGYDLKEEFCDATVRRFIRELPKIEVVEAMKLACRYMKSAHGENARENSIRYFCGICWKKIRGE